MFFIRKHFLMILAGSFIFINLHIFQNQLYSMTSDDGYDLARSYLHTFLCFSKTLRLPPDICRHIFLILGDFAYSHAFKELSNNLTLLLSYTRNVNFVNAYEYLLNIGPNNFNPSEIFFAEIERLYPFYNVEILSELVMEVFDELKIKVQHFAITKIHDNFCVFTTEDFWNATIILLIANQANQSISWKNPKKKGNIIKLEVALKTHGATDPIIISTFIDKKTFKKIIEALSKISKPKAKCFIQ